MTGILPTSYFGSIGYFRELVKYDSVGIESKEHFPKQTYRNRCDILAGDGIMSLSIPIKRRDGSKTTTETILLSNDENWRIRHWRSITSAYQASPFFDYYGREVKELLFTDETSLLNFNTEITTRILRWLDIETLLFHTEEFSPVMEDDLRRNLVSKESFQTVKPSPYIQVFPGPKNYRESLSILDAIFCEGPMARNLLTRKK